MNSLFLSNFLFSEIEIIGKSLITFEQNITIQKKITDWIFFTSRNAVKYFFNMYSIEENQKIACVGSGTFKVLSSYVDKVDYIGDSVNIEKIGREFYALVANGNCLFPVSNISKRTIQRYFIKEDKAIDIIVYKTFPLDVKSIPETEVLVFTSPSNVRVYHKSKGITNQHKIVAMGPSTGNELLELGFTNYVIPKIPGELGIIDELNNLTLI